MGSKDWLNKVAKLHKEWLKIATVYGAGSSAEDMVQDSYIKLIKYDCQHQVIKNGNVNKGFMFFIVKNTVLNYHKKKVYFVEPSKSVYKNSDFTEGEDYYYDNHLSQIPDTPLSGYEEAYNTFCEKVDEVSQQWKWSDRKIFDDYRFTEDSIRGVGKKYDISFVSIFGTIKECKKHLLYELKEDWEDLQNGTTTKSKPKKSKGLGDTVEKVTEATGIKKAVTWLLGDDCGCDERKDYLNKLFPYKRPECLTEGEYAFMASLEPFKRVDYTRPEVVRLVQINNRIFNERLNPGTSCGSCIKTVLDNLKKVYDEYK